MCAYKKAVVYPYNREFEPVVRHFDQLCISAEQIAVVSPAGLGLAGTKIGVLTKKGIEEHTVTDSLEEELPGSDALIVCDCPNPDILGPLVHNAIEIALQQKKTVYCFCQLDGDDLEQIRRKEGATGGRFHDCRANARTNEKMTPDVTRELLEPSIPVLQIMGISENTDKFEVQLLLRRLFQEQGYTVSQIGTRPYCEAFGFHSFPSFMTEIGLTESEKVYAMNQYVRSLIDEEHADLLIVGVPFPIQRYSQKHTNGFGILPFLLSQAFTPDFCLLCSFYYAEESNRFEEMSNYCHRRFGYPVDCIHMSAATVDVLTSQDRGELIYNFYDQSQVEKAVRQYRACDAAQVPLFHLQDERGQKDLFALILKKLTNEVEEMAEIEIDFGG